MDKEIKVGTKLFNCRYNIVGIVNEIYDKGFDGVTWYGVDEDSEYFWVPDEIRIIDDKEFLARKLKNTERMGADPDAQTFIPFK
jgi:hypothetical protein